MTRPDPDIFKYQGRHVLADTRGTGQRYTVKDPEEFPSDQEANHYSTRVKIRSQSERSTCRHQEPIIT
ncbi:hypothetical protein ACFX1Z_043739 [Malus domestica]